MQKNYSEWLKTYAGKRVFITGHTGFKGSWLTEWLLLLGAQIRGFSLPPPTQPSLFEQLNLAGRIDHQVGDIRDAQLLKKSALEFQPDFIFHLAAQPLVRTSYQQPRETYETNVMGTIHVLEVARDLKQPCALVCITTDKCYENRETGQAYREEDSLGGYDPYSSSKAAAEIAIASYRRSFFNPAENRTPFIGVASVRAGNVIGGGDWALDRIVPDSVRFLQKEEVIQVRNRHSTRPWQHVLEPVGGYLLLAAKIFEAATRDDSHSLRPLLCSAFNFGPRPESNRTVAELVTELLKHSSGSWVDKTDPNAPHEARLLQLDITKAGQQLSWKPAWNFEQAIAETMLWYNQAAQDPAAFTQNQIRRYIQDASSSS